MENDYTIDQLQQASIEYFNDDVLASNVWMNKYALKRGNTYLELTPTDTTERMVREIHRAELQFPNPLSIEEIRDAIGDFKHFIFGGSILFGLGNDHQVSSLGNCFFIDNATDSYGGIFNLDESAAQLMKRRGGVGITLEHLRPTGTPVNNSAHSSTGATSFMHRFSNTTREVAQDGRRGALMLTIHVGHPDVRSFVMMKDDRTKVTGANISVKITDDFMKAVESDSDYYLKWPINRPIDTSEVLQYNKLYKRKDGTHVVRIKARDLWNTIVKQAHKNAEPGVIFWDRVIQESPADCYSKDGMVTTGTNPCIVGETLIAVADGRNAVSIKQLTKEGKDVPVYSTNIQTGKTEIKWGRNPRLTQKNAEVWKLKLDDGSELIATPDHKILTSKLEYKELRELKKGESIIPFYSFESNGYRQISRTGAKMIGGNFRNKRQYRVIDEFFNGPIDAKKYHIHHKDSDNKNDSIENLQRMLAEEHKELHASRIRGNKNPYHQMNKEWKKKFASHPGKSNGRYSGWTNAELLNLGKDVFLAEGKLTRNIWYNYAKKTGAPLRLSNEFRFGSFMNFKNQVAENHKVVEVKFYGNEDVYNISVDDNHNYHVITTYEDDNFIKSSGICIKNCGEVPLSPFDSCRLGSINLNSMVLNPYTDKAKIDWKLLARISHLSQRFMDDIVTLEEEKVLAIIKKIENDPEDQEYRQVELNLWNKVLTVLRKGRRTGLGVLGLGDMLAKLGVKYDTPESTKLKEEIVKCIAVNSYKESVTMAKERGAFPLWDADTEAHNPIVRRIVGDNFSEAEYTDYLQYGRRNIANMAIAPTGSLAILCQTTSGIEPVFKITYKRKRKVNPNDKNLTRPTTTDDTGDTWEEYPVFHHEFVKWFATLHPEIESPEDHLENLSDDEVDELVMKSPWWGSESHDIDPIEKVKSQGAIQRWVDHSISVTHNLPEKSTLDEVSRIYFEAWKAGCKGCTIYREGSRDGVLITKKKKEKFDEHHAPKRPKELTGDYYIATVKGQRYGVIVGLLQDRPYEIFAFANPEIRDTCRGKITKVRKGFYEFECDKGKISGLHLAAEALEERAHTIWVSMLLRHGAPIEHIVNVAKKVDDNISSFSSVVRRTLSRYIKSEGTEDKCPACEIGKLIREEGCIHCDTCDYSKC